MRSASNLSEPCLNSKDKIGTSSSRFGSSTQSQPPASGDNAPSPALSSSTYGLLGPKDHKSLTVVVDWADSCLTYAGLTYRVWQDHDADRLRGHLLFNDTEQFDLQVSYLEDRDNLAVFACGATLDSYPMPMTDEATVWATEIVRLELSHQIQQQEEREAMTRELAQ